MSRIPTIAATTVLICALAASPATAGGGGHGDQVCRGFGDGAELVLRDSCFEGTGHAVTVGETLTVVNEGQLPHTFTAVDGSFDSGHLAPGERFEVTFDEPGAVPVYCTLHATRDGEGMAGLVAVTDDGTAMQPARSQTGEGAAPGWSVWWVAGLVAVAASGLAAGRRIGRRRTAR